MSEKPIFANERNVYSSYRRRINRRSLEGRVQSAIGDLKREPARPNQEPLVDYLSDLTFSPPAPITAPGGTKIIFVYRHAA